MSGGPPLCSKYSYYRPREYGRSFTSSYEVFVFFRRRDTPASGPQEVYSYHKRGSWDLYFDFCVHPKPSRDNIIFRQAILELEIDNASFSLTAVCPDGPQDAPLLNGAGGQNCGCSTLFDWKISGTQDPDARKYTWELDPICYGQSAAKHPPQMVIGAAGTDPRCEKELKGYVHMNILKRRSISIAKRKSGRSKNEESNDNWKILINAKDLNMNAGQPHTGSSMTQNITSNFANSLIHVCSHP
ncbi:hypothetical protein TWF481_006732 [Arthrobotrys musiformis]|uniref:Uncharacterized protein n=1 Tax=Arthrobotrys musiformis TaxID=47236 RepID=A0AAV9WBE6_9PEZI